MQARDTIVAIATPLGQGGVGIVRVSGSQATAIAKAILGVVPNARRATFLPFLDENGDSLDQGIALYFSAPHSFTGEDVLELQAHGGPVVLDLILQRSLQLGCRLARPGEFSERAYLNDQLDLAQAEAVADLIESTTAAAARLAMRSLQGVFSREVHAVVEALVRLRMYVEAALDFPEEEIDFLADSRVNIDLQAIAEQLASIQARATQGRLMRDGMYLVIAGAPNVGKSSLLNALAGEDTAIVTDVPGTTRDVLRERIHIDGMPLHLIDTAGLRATEDQVEQEGIRRARAEIDKADLILWLMDASTDIASQLPTSSDLPEGIPVTLIHNKIDKLGRPIGLSVGPLGPEIALSVKTGDGLELLREHLKQRMGYQGVQEGGFMARRRHLDALARAADFVAAGRQALSAQGAPELLADDLRGAQQALGEITGEFSNEDLLDRIFTSFCIGK